MARSDSDSGIGDPYADLGKKTRTRNGCQNCRRKRRKCDEAKPNCSRCQKRGEQCEWGYKVTFRSQNVQGIPDDHPSMRNGRRRRPKSFQILDVTSEVVREYWTGSDVQLENQSAWTRDVFPPVDQTALPLRNTASLVDTPVTTPISSRSEPMHHGIPELSSPHGSMGLDYSTSPLDSASTMSPLIPRSIFIPTTEMEQNGVTAIDASNPQNVQLAAANLLSLREIQSRMAQVTTSSGLGAHTATTLQADVPFYPVIDSPTYDDGIFVPGSAYQELHTTLRTHMINTARSDVPSRRQSVANFEDHSSRELSTSSSVDSQEQTPTKFINTSKINNSTETLEYMLWKNYIEEMAKWVDKFDNNRHFEYALPILAKSHPHLRYSILALSARQMERCRPNHQSFNSLELYQEAIHQLVPQLPTRETAVIASCVVLCVLEMMSCSPKAWRRHLDGSAHLLQAVGITGFSGGVEQALFWCFARMDVCGGLISSDRTLIPICNWASKISCEVDRQMFTSQGFDMYANYAVYLLAKVTDLFKDCGPWSAKQSSKQVEYSRKWTALFTELQEWYSNRPKEMHAILSRPADRSNYAQPFATLLFSNGPAISGNQLYHTATLLMLQHQPANIQLNQLELDTDPKSVLWHARKICAISISNDHHGCWTNSVQPLWIAGKTMSHPSEHKAILNIYEKIERETGWGTKWRADDLLAYWGDAED